MKQKVTCVHKANIMKLGDGLFLNTFRRVAEEYKSSGIAYNDMIVDNTYVPGNDPLRLRTNSSPQLHAVGRQAPTVRRDGYAQPLRRHRFQHWCCSRRWTWHCPRMQCRICAFSITLTLQR